MQRRSFLYSVLAVAIAALLIAVPLALHSRAQSSSTGSPPLRDLVQEYAPVVMPKATAYSVFTTEPSTRHQVWYRISGGDALFRQRLRVFKENARPRPQNQLPPTSELRQELTTNTPTSWFVFPAETGIITYYFDGDHRTSPNGPWEDAFGLKVTRTRFANGNLYKLGFEDQASLDDYNDLEVQVAILQPA
ncbi:MAG: hypothetical protein HC929_10550 [Leptolyngbyaceae cyanobacterium SM2_5_2]|nr:hypothetical protein [Leptolyngbyaceae cyanobacterium SM2_5_2]